MPRVRVALRTAALLVVLLLAAVVPAAGKASTLRIGGLVSETGSASPYGLSELKGLRLAIPVLNTGRPPGVPRLQLRVLDDRSDPTAAQAGARRLIAGGSNVLLAPTLSPVAAAVGPIAQQARIGFIGVTTTTLDLKAIGPVAYRIALTENRLVPATLSLLRRRGVRTAALVFDSTDGYSAGAADAFRSAAQATGITIKTSVDLAGHGTQADLDSALRQAVAVHPQPILLALRSTQASESLIAARRTGTHASLAGGNGFNTASVITAAGSAANGLITAAPWNPMIRTAASRAFVAA
jgi:branched-chain amino acid transport system substrate-binding protein